jgi:hypothetical protein
MLGLHLHKEKVSNILHEEYLKKKEIEYAVGISEMWNTRYLYLFSSFKSEIIKMYHRVIFNSICIILVIIHAVIVSNNKVLMIIVEKQLSSSRCCCWNFYSIYLLHYCCKTLQMLDVEWFGIHAILHHIDKYLSVTYEREWFALSYLRGLLLLRTFIRCEWFPLVHCDIFHFADTLDKKKMALDKGGCAQSNSRPRLRHPLH